MRGEIIYKILDFISDQIIDQFDFADAFLSAGYGASRSKMQYEFSKIQDKRTISKLKKQKIDNLRKYLSKLKKAGLVGEDESKKIYLSKKGKGRLIYLQKSFLSNKNLYKKRLADRVTVISYDIPIAFNRERNILRDMLKMLGFNLIHKSVWIGRVLLPKRFISDLSNLGITDYVEILEVTKNGTLKEIN
ncbi:hypothetical protein HYZ82_00445 [Candidatus Nomurabacteria bacterium]|nr:hypothetical protein [Candidatus Nomurabacteria bacterium]